MNFINKNKLLAIIFYVIIASSGLVWGILKLPHQPLTVYYFIFFFLMILHSVEEQALNFADRCPFMRLTYTQFWLFEVFFIIVWIVPFLLPQLFIAKLMEAFFPILMFANGIWHLVWFWFFERGKRYVPGVVTGSLFVIIFLQFYFGFLL